MRRVWEIGGVVAGVVLVGFGIAVIALALNGRSTVHSELRDQQITGTPDMTPAAIRAEAAKAGLSGVALPSCSVANERIDTGDRARCFAQYMRVHALEASGGKVYAEMPQYATSDGQGTNDPAQALQQNGAPVSNPARNVWITETALSTALNVSYMADQLALFSLVVGIALLLTGVGFLVLTVGGALRRARTTA
ncbi:MAG TPA: hypothetical protein VFJ77_00205 [Gaiellaceae bacterium]|nr:hypothetical protein [Gaiellaceae bacterium]